MQDNVLLLRKPSGKLTVLITDFGLSRVIGNAEPGKVVLSRTYCGTPGYMAPEILDEKVNKQTLNRKQQQLIY